VLAQEIAGHFEEWLAEQERSREWSLQGALYEWLYDEAVRWTAESYELYVQVVVVIVANWSQQQPPNEFTYQFHGQGETKLTHLSDDQVDGRNYYWECIRRDQYERARFLWRLQEARSWRGELFSVGLQDGS